MQMDAVDDPLDNDLVQKDQHAMDIDAVAAPADAVPAAAGAVEAATVQGPVQQLIAYPGPEWDPDAVQEYIDDYLPKYAEHELDPLLQTAAAGNVPALQQQLAALGSSALGADHHGWTALHAAADSGQEKRR